MSLGGSLAHHRPMEPVRKHEPAQPLPERPPALAPTPVDAPHLGPATAPPVEWAPRRLQPASLLRLQRTVGNHATVALLRGEPGRLRRRPVAQRTRTAQRAEGPAAPSFKATYNLPEKELGQRDLGYVEATLSVSGLVDYEVTPPPPTAPPAEGGGGPPASGGPTPLPSPGSGEVKGSGGVSSGGDGMKYQAEVGVEFEKRAVGLFEGSTPKAKFGGEANADQGKLGLEFSMEGERFEPKFAFNLVEMDAQKGIHFASLETGIDWKIHEWTFVAKDGASVKVTPKVALKVVLEPDYERIFTYLLEEGGAEVAMEAAVAGGMIMAAAVTIVGFLMTLGDGEAEARAIDNASRARRQLVAGFTAGATGEDMQFSDDFTMEGHNRGTQWRNDLRQGKLGKGIPVPPSVLDEKTKENRAKIESSATATANQLMHEALVQRYWEIHWVRRELPFEKIDTIFMMLMEGQGFGRPEEQEGKNAAGASVLPE